MKSVAFTTLSSVLATKTIAFAPPSRFSYTSTMTPRLYKPFPMATATTASPLDTSMRDEINTMYIKDIRDELQSYGVDCSSIFEKKELVDALVKARREDWIRQEFDVGDTVTTGDSFEPTFWNNYEVTTSSEEEDATSKEDKSWFKQGLEDMADKVSSTLKDKVRKERVKLEMALIKDMKVKELREELESCGIPTNSYFEKSEFVKALAEARVDGVDKKSTKTAASSSGKRNNSQNGDWDRSYKDVFVTRFDSRLIDPSSVIDVQARQ